MVAVEGQGDVAVFPDALLDRLGVLLAAEEGLPGVEVLRLVEVAVRQEGEPLQADGGVEVVAVGDFPGVEEGGEFVLMFPEVEGVLPPLALELVRVGGDGEAACRLPALW